MNIALPSPLDPVLIVGLVVLALGLAALALPERVRRLPGGRILTAAPVVLALGGVVLVGSTFFVATPMTRVGSPIPATVDSIAAGEGVYLNSCARCHGIDARGGGPDSGTTPVRPPALVGAGSHLSHHTDGDLFYDISNGLPGGMPPWRGTLSDDEIWHVVNYLRSL